MRHQIEAATGAEVVRWSMLSRPRFDMVAGWGQKPTSAKARLLAERTSTRYVSLEDGWIRSIEPGPQEAPLSIVVDRVGTHYVASRPTELEQLIALSARRAGSPARAHRAIGMLRGHAISKYNAAPMLSPRRLGLGPRPAGGRVLVVDQTVGDASVAGGLASIATFARMLAAARAENPDAELIVKTHPEVVSGRKQGYLGHATGPGIRLLSDAVNPWSLLEAVDRVYVVSSQLGFEALMAGLPVVCFGAPYYAGWGLTDDRIVIQRRTARPTLEQLFSALYFDYARYVTPDGQRIEFEDAVEWVVSKRAEVAGRGREPTPAWQPLRGAEATAPATAFVGA